MSIERRRSPRTTLPVPLRFQYAEARTARWHEGLLLDISAGGMRFTAEEVIPLGTTLQFELVFPTRVAPYRFKGRAVWIRESASVEYGAELLDIAPDQENDLNELIRFLSAPPPGTPHAK